MKKSSNSDLSRDVIDKIVQLAQEEKKPFEEIKKQFGLPEKEVTEIMRKRLSPDNFELWKKQTAAKKPKPKPQAYNDLEDLDDKYYFKNKFD